MGVPIFRGDHGFDSSGDVFDDLTTNMPRRRALAIAKQTPEMLFVTPNHDQFDIEGLSSV